MAYTSAYVPVKTGIEGSKTQTRILDCKLYSEIGISLTYPSILELFKFDIDRKNTVFFF